MSDVSDKGIVRLQETPVVSDDGRVDMASLSKSGCRIGNGTKSVFGICVGGGDSDG